MSEYFIQKLFIKDVRGVKDFEIPLSETERKHLIITGKNGSGKTSVLLAINNVFEKLTKGFFIDIDKLEIEINQNYSYIDVANNSIVQYERKELPLVAFHNDTFENNHMLRGYRDEITKEKSRIRNFEENIAKWQVDINQFTNEIRLYFVDYEKVDNLILQNKFALVFFEAKRRSEPFIPDAPSKLDLKIDSTKEALNKKILQYMLNLKVNQAFAQIKNDMETVEKIGGWFDNFEKQLKEIFENDELRFVFYEHDYSFKIEYDDKSLGLNELSDGYSSILAILTELLLRMEAHSTKAYDMQGVVLIDEIETHLHVELQKKILPFLISFFPKIQFIVTTHSPFVLSSVSNAVICDLERREIVDSERFVNASYSQIVKNYFEVDSEFSSVLLNYIKQYEDMVSLFENGALDESRQKELLDLDIKLEKISPMLSDEIYLRFKEAQEKIQNND